jgi:hypothetical protein
MVIINFLVPQAFAYIVFIVGAVLILANLIITIIFYKNPVKNDPTEKITTGFKNLGFVLSDKKFTVLLLIYAGFFFLMSAMHTFLTVYYTGFGIQAFEWFRAPLMSAVNPFTIVILGPFLAKFMDKFNSLKLMISGIFMFCIGLLILGIFPIWYIMIIGTVIFSIGEFITHPNFISYVSKIAPKDRVAMYMGFAFLPSAIGQMFGGLVGGFFWDVIAVGASKPKLFWAIYVGIGLFTIGNFLIYNRVINKDKIGKKASGFFNHKYSFLAAWALIPIVILATYSMSGLEYKDPGGDGGEDHDYHYEIGTGTINFGGQLNDGGSADHEFLIEGSGLIWVNITLTWTDEADQTLIFRTFQNQPDSFRMTYEPVNSTEVSDSGSNPRNGQGELVLSQKYEFEEKDHTSGTGVHLVRVDLTDVGEYSGIGPGILIDPDTGNSYSVRIDYTYWEKVENQ